MTNQRRFALIGQTGGGDAPNVDSGNVGDSVYAVRSTDLSRTSTIAVAADPDFAISLAASSLFAYEAVITIDTSDTQGFRFSITGPAVFRGRYATLDADGVTANEGSFSQNSEITLTSAGPQQVIVIKGLIETASSATLDFNWAQETSSALNTTVITGSWIRLTRTRALEGSSSSAPTYAALIGEIGPDNWWRLNESAGDAQDSGSRTDALTPFGSPTYNSPPIVTPSLSAIDFDGVDDLFNTFSRVPTDTTGFVQAIVRLDDDSDVAYGILNSNNAGGANGFFWFYFPGTGISVTLRRSSSNRHQVRWNIPLTVGTVYHMIVQQAADNNGLVLWVNGTKYTETDPTATIIDQGVSTNNEWFGFAHTGSNPPDRLTVGAQTITAGTFFPWDGVISEVIYDTAVLSDQQVADIVTSLSIT